MTSEDQVSAVFLLRNDGAALMQLRDDKLGLRHAGMWVPPGGHREPGEDGATCARREFREETEYECRELVHLRSFLDEQPGFAPYELSVYRADYDGEQSICCHEGQAVQFIRRQEASVFDVPAYLVELWDMAIATETQGELQRE